jgi:hypothetical protein
MIAYFYVSMMLFIRPNILKQQQKRFNLILLNALIFSILMCSHVNAQLIGSEKTMEQFLDRLLHESVYDRRIRPFYTDSRSIKHFLLVSIYTVHVIDIYIIDMPAQSLN